MTDAMHDLLSILDLERLEDNRFRGRSLKNSWRRIYGGQVIAQSLVAAQRTVDPARHVHSLHCYFLRPGDPHEPVFFDVDRIRDGASFTTRRVVASQRDKAIFSLSASFQIDEPGLDHFKPMPEGVPQPETLLGDKDFREKYTQLMPENVRSYMAQERPIEIKPISLTHYLSREKLPPEQQIWIRANGEVPDDRALQAAVLAYLSDMTLLDTSLFAHGRSIFNPDLQVASLDHGMWFHRPVRLDDWLLYVQDSPSTQGARGYSRGALYSRDGQLIASVAQEGLIRVHELR